MLKKVVLGVIVLSLSVLGCTSTDENKSEEELAASGAEVTDMDTSSSLGSLTGDAASSSEDVVYFGYDEYTLDDDHYHYYL